MTRNEVSASDINSVCYQFILCTGIYSYVVNSFIARASYRISSLAVLVLSSTINVVLLAQHL